MKEPIQYISPEIADVETQMNKFEKCQEFAALGKVIDDEIYQFEACK